MPDPDFRALCAELVLSWDADGCDWKPQHQARWEATLARARAALAETTPDTDDVSRLAAIIRDVDGNHDKGAAALAEAILGHPDHPTARAALAEGEKGPSDERNSPSWHELWDFVFNEHDIQSNPALVVAVVREALARWGSIPPRPVPVSERLNDAHLEEIARAFSDEPVEVAAFICGARWAEYKLKPGPAHAIPTPENTDV